MSSREFPTEFPEDYFPATLNDTLHAASRTALHLIERLVRTLRRLEGKPVSLIALLESGPMATSGPDELREACEWLVANGHANWVQDRESVCLLPAPRDRSTSRPAAGGRGRMGAKA